MLATAGQARSTPGLHEVLKGRAATSEALDGHGFQSVRYLDLKDELGLASLDLTTNHLWHEDPRRLVFLLARYRFVAKMLKDRRSLGEVGCGDAFGTRVVLQEVDEVTVYDFDPVLIEDVRQRRSERWPIDAYVHDIVTDALPNKHDGVYSLDLIGRLRGEDEHAYIANLRGSLGGRRRADHRHALGRGAGLFLAAGQDVGVSQLQEWDGAQGIDGALFRPRLHLLDE